MKKLIMIIFSLSFLASAGTVYGGSWDNDEELREAINHAKAIGSENLNSLDTFALLEAYIYLSIANFPMSAMAEDALLLLESRSDLTSDNVMKIMSEIKFADFGTSNFLLDSGFWALINLYDISQFHGLLNSEQEPRAFELVLGFVARAVEYTVRTDAAHNHLMVVVAESLVADNWLDYGESLDRFDRNQNVELFLDHFGVTARRCNPLSSVSSMQCR